MNDDLVERLRTFDIYDYADADKICREAAARIKSQAARIETLEAALRNLDDMIVDLDAGHLELQQVSRFINAALTGGKDE